MKKLISIIMISMMLMILTSCNIIKNDDNATIQIWWYDYDNAGYYSKALETAIRKVELYCQGNNIPVEIVRYGEDTLAYEDYVLKRNSAMANGNMITIDDGRSLQDVAKYHADYSKAENYDKLLDVYKNRFCVPLGMGYETIGIDNELLAYYDMDVDKILILYDDYLEIKQQLKEKGAKFKLNKREWNEILNYHLAKNGLAYIDEQNEITKNTNELKETVKKTIIEVYEDFKLYNGDYEASISMNEKKESIQDYFIFDTNTGLKLADSSKGFNMMTNYIDYTELNDDILKMTFVVNNNIFVSPCAYMHKKITNDKIYDVFNELISDSYYKSLSTTHPYAPILNTEKVKEFLEVDENWEYNGLLIGGAMNGIEKNKKVVNLINETYEMLIKDKEKSENIASNYFKNGNFTSHIYNCVSDLSRYLINEKLDYNDKKVDDALNQKIDEFITNLNVLYN